MCARYGQCSRLISFRISDIPRAAHFIVSVTQLMAPVGQSETPRCRSGLRLPTGIDAACIRAGLLGDRADREGGNDLGEKAAASRGTCMVSGTQLLVAVSGKRDLVVGHSGFQLGVGSGDLFIGAVSTPMCGVRRNVYGGSPA